MQDAHLRLEAARVDWAPGGDGIGIDGPAPKRAARAVALDRRVASLGGNVAIAEALLGYVILPWCDVTLWSVMSRGAGNGEPAGCDLPGRVLDAATRARAWMRVELDHIDAALAYVERLPVTQGLAAKAWRWRWSSAPWHCGFGAKPRALAPEWVGPVRRDLWRERLAGAFVGRSDRSAPVIDPAGDTSGLSPGIAGSALDRLAQRGGGHSPGMPSCAETTGDAIEPSQGELAVA